MSISNGTVLAGSSAIWGPERREVERSETERSGGPQIAPPPDPEVRATSSRRRFSLEYKRRILQQAQDCRETGQVSALLRREGLYSSHLAAWRTQLAAGPKQRGRKPRAPALCAQLEENRKLALENARLKRRLSHAEAIIDIQKKVSALLGIPLNHPDSEGSA